MEKFSVDYSTEFGHIEGYTTEWERGKHPYVIGVKHVAYAADNQGGILDQYVMDRFPCDHCKKPYSDAVHTSIKIAHVYLDRDASEQEVSHWLSGIKPELEAQGIGGFTFKGKKILRNGKDIFAR